MTENPAHQTSAGARDGEESVEEQKEGDISAVLTGTEYSPSTVAFLGTLQISLMYLVDPIAGAAFDRCGLKWLYPFGGAGCCGALLGLSFSKPGEIYQQFLSQGVLFGLCMSFSIQPALAVVGQHFNKQRGLAMEVVAGGSSIGGVCLPIMFSGIVPTIDFAGSVRMAALILACCYLTAMLILRTKVAPDNNSAARGRRSLGSLLDFSGYKDLRYVVLAIGCFVANLGLYVPYYYIESYTLLRHPSSSIHSYMLPLINGTSFFGRILGGYVADRIGRLNLLYPMTFASGLFCLAMWLPAGRLSVVIAFVCLYGLSSGIFISVTPAVVAQISPEERIGA